MKRATSCDEMSVSPVEEDTTSKNPSTTTIVRGRIGSSFAAPKPSTNNSSSPKTTRGGVTTSGAAATTINPFDEDTTGHASLFGAGGGNSGSQVQRTKSLDVASIMERRRCAVEARNRTERAHQEHIEALQHAKEQEDLLHAAEEAFRSKQAKVWSDRYDGLKDEYARVKEERDTLKEQLERNQLRTAELQKENQQQDEWIKKLQENLYETTKSLANDKKSTIGRIFGGGGAAASGGGASGGISRGPSESLSPRGGGGNNLTIPESGGGGTMSRNSSFLGRLTPVLFGNNNNAPPAYDYTPSTPRKEA